MDNQMEMFDALQSDTSITTETLDDAVKQMAQAKAEYESKKVISTEAYHHYQRCQGALIGLLKQAGKSKYVVDGVGTVSVKDKLKVRVPKSAEDKSRFFKWLNDRYGADGFLTYVGVNYQTMNGLYNQEFEHAAEMGTADEFEIPGIEQPVAEPSLSFRK